jgi:hypothetical protein
MEILISKNLFDNYVYNIECCLCSVGQWHILSLYGLQLHISSYDIICLLTLFLWT